MSDSVAEQVVATLASVKRIPREKISLESSLRDLGVDSLDTIILLSELENKFQIGIPDEEARTVRSVHDIIAGIQRLVAQAPLDSVAPAE